MFDENNILLLKSPLLNKQQSSSCATPSWDDYVKETLLGEGAYGKVFKVYKKSQSQQSTEINAIQMFESIDKSQQDKNKAKTTKNYGITEKQSTFSSAVKVVPDNKQVKPTHYVIKELYTDLMPKYFALQAMEEIQILGSLNSPHIVGYIDSFVSETKVCIIMEFCEHGDLQTFLTMKKQQKQYIPENSIWKYFIQICLGVHYLHSIDILHRDLKPLNIFMCRDNQLKIGDLGVARKIIDNQESQKENQNSLVSKSIDQTTRVGTPFYLAPEIWEDKPYTDKSDIWSLGVILYEMCALDKPFIAENEMDLKQKILKDNLKFPDHISKEFQELIKKMIRKNPQQRPSIKEILQYQIIKQKAKQFKIELPTLISNYKHKSSNSTSKNYQSTGKVLQNDSKQKILHRKHTNTGLESNKSKKMFSDNTTISLKSTAKLDKQCVFPQQDKVLQKSPKIPSKKLTSAFGNVNKMTLKTQRSVDSLGSLLGQMKHTKIILQSKIQNNGQNTTQNVSQTSFNSNTPVNNNLITQKRSILKSQFNQLQKRQVTNQGLQSHEKLNNGTQSTTPGGSNTVDNSICNSKNVKKTPSKFYASKITFIASRDNQISGRLTARNDARYKGGVSQFPSKNNSIASGSNKSFAKNYQTHLNKEQKEDTDKKAQIQKWASKVTDRLLQKTKSTNLFRNHQKNLKNIGSEEQLAKKAIINNKIEDSVIKEEPYKISKNLTSRSKLLMGSVSQSHDFSLRKNELNQGSINKDIKQTKLRKPTKIALNPQTQNLKGSKISIRKSNPSEYKGTVQNIQTNQHRNKIGSNTTKQLQAVQSQALLHSKKQSQFDKPFWDMTFDDESKIMKFDQQKSVYDNEDEDDLLRDLRDGQNDSNMLINLDNDDQFQNNNFLKRRNNIMFDSINNSTDDNPFGSSVIIDRTLDI